MTSTADQGFVRRRLPESLLARALVTVSEGSLITDAQQNVLYANSAFTAITGYAQHEIVGRNCRFLQGDETDPETIVAIRAALAAGNSFQGDILNLRKSGERFWNSLTITPLKNSLGVITHFVSVQRDISMQVALQERNHALLKETELQRETGHLLLEVARSLNQRSSVSTVAQTLAEAVPVVFRADRSAVALWDADAGRLVVAGSSGWDGELLERLQNYVTTPEESPELARLLETGAPVLVDHEGSAWARDVLSQFEVEALAAVPIATEGQVRGLLVAYWAATPPPPRLHATLQDRMSGLAGLAAVALDNTGLFEKVSWDAEHDSLTRLPNRALLEKSLVASLEAARAKGTRVAVIFCDIDRLKRANDSLGHQAGDAVVRHVADHLQSSVRDGALVARLGGDEFLIVLPNVTSTGQATLVADRIRKSLQHPLDVAGRKLFVNVSMGIAFSEDETQGEPRGSLHQAAEQLINSADADMYRAKARDRGGAATPPVADELRLDSDLHGATRRGEIIAFYQPQIDLASGRIVALEALARWQHPELGLLAPDLFIPIAEDNGLIHEIGESILLDACRVGAGWRERGVALEVSVNVSATQLASSDFYQCVDFALAETNLPPSALTLEITESHLVADLPVVREQVRRLRDLEIGISIDDFGTGYSSLTQLLDFPISELKIDKSFVQSDEVIGAALVTAVVSLGRGLKLRVVAEGVETIEQLQMVRGLGCDRVQGFLMANPTSADQLEALWSLTS